MQAALLHIFIRHPFIATTAAAMLVAFVETPQ